MKASDALKIAAANDPQRANKILRDLYFRINQAALRGEYRLMDRSFISEFNAYRPVSEYPEFVRRVLENLRANGYTATICCNDATQFVDSYLEIDWSEARLVAPETPTKDNGQKK